MLRLACLVSLVLGAGACTLHFGGDDTGDDVCNPPPNQQVPAAPLDLRNPETLECQSFAEPSYCPPGCPCELDTTTDAVPIPTWGWCSSTCDGLAPDACMAAAECRAAYDYNCWVNDALCPLETPFLGCFPVDQSGPVSGGSCVGLDSWSCSLHNDCLALHTQQCTGSGPTQTCWQQFIECVPEPMPTPCGVDNPACGVR